VAEEVAPQRVHRACNAVGARVRQSFWKRLLCFQSMMQPCGQGRGRALTTTTPPKLVSRRGRVRHDFRKAQHETDPARIQFLLQLGETQLDNVLYALKPPLPKASCRTEPQSRRTVKNLSSAECADCVRLWRSAQAEHLSEIAKMDLSNIKGVKTTVV